MDTELDTTRPESPTEFRDRKRHKTGRPSIFKRAMTDAERQRRCRAKKRLAAKALKAFIGKAQQRAINDRLAAEAEAVGDRWWERLDLSLARSEVRPISFPEARAIIGQFEPMPPVKLHAFGLFFDGHCGGAVVYSPEYGENSPGVWCKYGFDGRIICLTRGACLHWTPKNSASRLIRGSMRLLPPRYEIVTATGDSTLGEVGTVYQAAGFVYAKMNSKGGNFTANGIGSRALRRQGLKNKTDIELRGFKPKRQHQKLRFFAFRGPRTARRKHCAAIAHLIAPYPKRSGRAVSST